MSIKPQPVWLGDLGSDIHCVIWGVFSVASTVCECCGLLSSTTIVLKDFISHLNVLRAVAYK